jgi:hypothetical protein
MATPPQRIPYNLQILRLILALEKAYLGFGDEKLEKWDDFTYLLSRYPSIMYHLVTDLLSLDSCDFETG